MSELTANLQMPLIAPSQAQKHVTHNEALLRMDAVVQLSALTASQTSAPASPSEGDCYLVTSGATGVWQGHDLAVAAFQKGGWIYLAPNTGWRCYVQDTSALMVFDGAAWIPLEADHQNMAGIGVNSSYDATNRLALSSPSSLFSHEGAGHQIKVNRASTSDTASILFQNNWSGQAEFGMVGSDDFQIKTSTDGTNFESALSIDPLTALTKTKGLSSGEITVLKDGVNTLMTPASSGFFLLTLVNAVYPQLRHSGIFLFDTGASLDILTVYAASSMNNLGAQTLTGTTGVAAKTSVAVAAGAIQIENQYNQNATYRYTFLCT